jgi:sugar lactone lactonase YvrE
VDDNQTVYIADFGNDRVMEWKSGATSGQVVVGRNGKGWLDEQLNGPKDVIVDKETDKLIICDSGNEQVVQWPRQGGTDGETIIFYVSCTDLTMDDNGFLYVFDHDRNEVRRWLIRKINRIVMKYDEGQDLFRDQLIYDRNGFADRHHLLYTPKVSNRRVAHSLGRIKQAVSYVSGRRDFGQRFKNLAKHRGVVMDQLGTAYVADCVNNRIMRWPKGAAQGSIIIDGNGKKAESNQLSCPRGLSFDRHGNLYVADARNHRVQRFNIKRSL